MSDSALDDFTIAETTVPPRLRIVRGPDIRYILDSIGSLDPFAREHGPGRYDVDEHSLDPFPGTNCPQGRCGKVTGHQDGQVVLDPIPWPTS
jgi:hypothetical protein